MYRLPRSRFYNSSNETAPHSVPINLPAPLRIPRWKSYCAISMVQQTVSALFARLYCYFLPEML